jgi:hypothetical protein
VVDCPPALALILKSCSWIDSLVSRGSGRPAFDLYAPLMSLPAVFGTTLDTVPAPIPYLAADPQLVDRWGQLLGADTGARFRIGVCWRGHPKNKSDARRSFKLEDLEPLAHAPGVELVNLQKHVGTNELADVGCRFGVRELPGLDEQAGPFMDTAAVLQHLDLVVSCDSSVAHLAGAMGIPVWLALPHAAEWRWMLHRKDSPWYPKHRLFRQPRPGDWLAVFRKMVTELLPLTSIREKSP